MILTYLVPVLFTFYIQDVLNLKNNSGVKRLSKPKMICDYSDFDDNNLDITWRTLQKNFRNASYRKLCLKMEAAC